METTINIISVLIGFGLGFIFTFWLTRFEMRKMEKENIKLREDSNKFYEFFISQYKLTGKSLDNNPPQAITD